jgi:hypothetical protein
MPQKIDEHELPGDQVLRLPMGYQKVLRKPLLPAHVSDKLILANQKFGSRAAARGSDKPISKIVE